MDLPALQATTLMVDRAEILLRRSATKWLRLYG